MPARLLFIDNIRWSIILLVLSMHASDTYSPFGNWYYTDRPPLSLGERVFFATYQSWLQAFFMALLFFVAACFAPASCDRKGAVRYVRDRFVRLVVPTLLYMFVIGPLTEYYISKSWTGGGGFTQQWLEHVTDGEWVSGSGPMWFCLVLFAFCVVYAGTYAGTRLNSEAPSPAGRPVPSPVPSPLAVLAFILAMALGTFVVRTFAPGSTSILNIHPGDLPQYGLMFAAGILAFLVFPAAQTNSIPSGRGLDRAFNFAPYLDTRARSAHLSRCRSTHRGRSHFASKRRVLWCRSPRRLPLTRPSARCHPGRSIHP
jgi:glucan biosynthesis protein C